MGDTSIGLLQRADGVGDFGWRIRQRGKFLRQFLCRIQSIADGGKIAWPATPDD